MVAKTRFCAIAAGALMLLDSGASWAQTSGDLPPFPDGSHDFDFLIGSWKAHLRKLVNPLTGSTTWIEFDGTSVTRKLLDTDANLEDFHVQGANGQRDGHTLRLYNPKSGQWSIYLADLKAGQLAPPAVVGRFVGGKGEFVDQEAWGGRMILVRYQWTPQGPNKAHMEQSFSDDNGKSWEVNWVLDLTREGP